MTSQVLQPQPVEPLEVPEPDDRPTGRRPGVKHVVFGLVIAAVLYLGLGPVVVLLVSSVNSNGSSLPFERRGVSFANYTRLLSDPGTYSMLLYTAAFAIGSLLLAFVISFAIGWLVERSNMPARRLCYVLVIVPLAIPGMLSAISWIMLFGPTGMISGVLHDLVPAWQNPLNIYSLPGMILVEGLRAVPIMFLMISPALARMDPSLEEQSRVSGRGAVHSIFSVTLQVLRPALLAAVLIVGLAIIEAFDVPILLGPTAGINVFSTQVYYLSQAPSGGLPDYGMASASAVLILVIALILLSGYRRVTRESRRFTTVSARGFRARRINLGRWRWVALWAVLLYAVVTVLLPLTVLVWASLLPFLQVPSAKALSFVSPEAYQTLWSYPGVAEAVINTLVIAVVASTATVVLTTLTSWISVRTASFVQGPVRILTYLPIAIPGVVIGYALLLMHLRFLTVIYGTVWIIAIGFVVKGMAVGHRLLESAHTQFDPQLEEASATCGATWWYTLRRVTVPLLVPAILSVWTLMFVFCTRDLSIPAQLFAQDNGTLSNTIYRLWNQGAVQEASALGVVLTAVLAVITFAGRTLADRKSGDGAQEQVIV